MEPTVASGLLPVAWPEFITLYICVLCTFLNVYSISQFQKALKEAVQDWYDSLKSSSETQNPFQTCAFLSLGRDPHGSFRHGASAFCPHEMRNEKKIS